MKYSSSKQVDIEIGMEHGVGSHRGRAVGRDQKDGLPRHGAGPGRDSGPDLERSNGGYGSRLRRIYTEMPEGGSLPTSLEHGEVGPAPQGRPTGELAVGIPCWNTLEYDDTCWNRRRPSGTTHVRTGTGLARQPVRLPEGTFDDRLGQARTGTHGRHGFPGRRGVGSVSGHRQRVQHHAVEQDSGSLGTLRGSYLPRSADPRLLRRQVGMPAAKGRKGGPSSAAFRTPTG